MTRKNEYVITIPLSWGDKTSITSETVRLETGDMSPWGQKR